MDIIERIAQNNREREENWLSPTACLSADAIARPDREGDPTDWGGIRSAFFYDADKILHSSAYTRYIDKTQTFYLFDNDLITHRVLHVQFVAKIARTIARALRLNEDLTEAIALGHDIGHVPFGHDGEKFLDAICHEHGIGGFCHNAQSVRWMLEIEKRGTGLALSLQTLDGMLCHNGEIWKPRMTPNRQKDWQAFQNEYRQCLREPKSSKALVPMTLEGCVVRYADVIAYVGRDVEDAIKLDLVERNELPEAAVDVLGDTNSSIINTLATDLIEFSLDRDEIGYSDSVHEGLLRLLEFNYDRIYKNPRVREKDEKLSRLFRVIFKQCLDDLNHQRPDTPIMRFAQWRSLGTYHRDTPPARMVVDFISGMTDAYFLAQARQNLLPSGFGETV